MGFMKKLIYRLSFFVALLTFLINLLNGITILTSITRSAIVFLVMMLLSVVTLKILHWTLMLKENEPMEDSVETTKK